MPLDSFEPVLLRNALLYNCICILMKDETALFHINISKLDIFAKFVQHIPTSANLAIPEKRCILCLLNKNFCEYQ